MSCHVIESIVRSRGSVFLFFAWRTDLIESGKMFSHSRFIANYNRKLQCLLCDANHNLR